MPQFDFAQALPQIVWLTLVFGMLFLIVRGLLPRVDRVVENRAQRIASDLRSAEAARAEAEAATSGGSSAIADARGRALAVTGKAREAASEAMARRLAEVDETLAMKAEAAAASLATTRAAALAELDQLAAEATVELVKRVGGIDIDSAEAAQIVRKVAA